MRIALIVLAVLTLGAMSDSARADPYRWCADYGGKAGGSSNCYFMTLDQCRASISGMGGFCRHNPFYTGGDAIQRRKRRS